MGLDYHDPDAAVFTCRVGSAGQSDAGYTDRGGRSEGHSSGHGYSQDPQPGLPAGWAVGVDEGSGATYYYNERTGEAQWERPQQGGYSQGGGY